MSLISLFTKKAPTFNIGGGIIAFDAVLEDTLEAAVEIMMDSSYRIKTLKMGT